MRRLRMKVRKAMWLTLSAADSDFEKIALLTLVRLLGDARQDSYVHKAIGERLRCSGLWQSHSESYAVNIAWQATLRNDELMEVCDWFSPIAYLAFREGSFAALKAMVRTAESEIGRVPA